MIISFMEQFAAEVEAGLKACTIRFREKQIPKVGQRLSLWKTARGKDRRLIGVAECTKVSSIRLVYPHVWVNEKMLGDGAFKKLAKQDGFSAIDLFWDFFGREEPQLGYLIEWNPKQITGEELRPELEQHGDCTGPAIEEWYPATSDTGILFEAYWCECCRKNTPDKPCHTLTMAFVESKCKLWRQAEKNVVCLGYLPRQEKTKPKPVECKGQLNLFEPCE